jgi:hypothetical protein
LEAVKEKFEFDIFSSPLKLWLSPCNRSDTEQKWYFTNYDEEGIPTIPTITDEEMEHDEF